MKKGNIVEFFLMWLLAIGAIEVLGYFVSIYDIVSCYLSIKKVSPYKMTLFWESLRQSIPDIAGDLFIQVLIAGIFLRAKDQWKIWNK